MDEFYPLIRITDLGFSYPEGRRVLDGLSLVFEPGLKAGLTGANGTGKTTLFHLIMGLLRPTSGRLEIFGRPRTREEDFREVRAGIGFVFQEADDQLFCPTVADDVAFGPLNLGLGRDEAHARVHEALDLLGLGAYEHRITYQLSGGEKKLVSLATVLSMKPRLLLLDEPTAGLDEPASERLVQVLNDLGLPLFIISHDRDFLKKTVTHLFRLEAGRIR